MSETNMTPIPTSERIETLDVLRGLAVGGILIGNMQWFSGYGMMPEAMLAQTPLYDRIAHFIVHFLIEGKFYSIFSFLFGFGFALQIARGKQRGDLHGTLFTRRLLWLVVIGVLHAYLLWAGDILSIYALIGFVLLAFRNMSDRWVLRWAAILLAFPVFTYILQYILFTNFAPPNLAAEIEAMKNSRWTESVAVVANSTYWQIISGYNLDYIVGRYMGLIFDMRLPKILAMFLLGMYAYRRGIFQDPESHGPFINKVMVWGLSVGLIGNFIFAIVSGHETTVPPTVMGIFGVVLYAVSVPALALGIAATVVNLWTSFGRGFLTIFAPAGRMALTNYLMQTIICVTIFYGYGFGYFGQVGALQASVIALGIFAFQIVVSTLWLSTFRYGPVEWIWRQLTYWKRLPITRDA